MRATTFLTALGIASLGFWGCSQSTGPTASATSGDGSLGAALVGTWMADTSVSVQSGSLSVPVSVSASVLFHPDSSFNSHLDGDSVLGAPLQGHLFMETGTWSSHGMDTVVVHPDSCMAPDTATIALGGFLSVSLPFHLQGLVYVVNAPIPTACPDSLLIATHPVHDTLRLQLPVTVPIQGPTLWHLTFLKQ
jgi:hypothetical protein